MSASGLWPYLLVIVFGFLPSEVWRVLAVFAARGFDERAEILVWVRAVATTLVAGVVAKILFSPTGALVAVPLAWRLGALAISPTSFGSLSTAAWASHPDCRGSSTPGCPRQTLQGATSPEM